MLHNNYSFGRRPALVLSFFFLIFFKSYLDRFKYVHNLIPIKNKIFLFFFSSCRCFRFAQIRRLNIQVQLVEELLEYALPIFSLVFRRRDMQMLRFIYFLFYFTFLLFSIFSWVNFLCLFKL